MKWPLQREAHARQDKVQKPDYREELALEGDAFDRGGSEPPKLKALATIRGNTIVFNVNLPSYKTDAQIFLEHTLRNESIFQQRGYVAALRWGKKAFCKHNKIDRNTGDAVFAVVINELEDIYKFTVNNLRRVERETGYSWIVRDGIEKKHYQFRSGFVPIRTGKLETKKFLLDTDFFNVRKPPV